MVAELRPQPLGPRRAGRLLPWSVDRYLEKGGKDLVAVGADAPLAVGSSFKPSYINALSDAVQTGRLFWSRIVPLQAKWRSVPSGILQDWPAGAPVTVETLAGLMISLSDNTAADAVMDVVGRAVIAKYGYGNDPILTRVFADRNSQIDRDDAAARDGRDRRHQPLAARVAIQRMPAVHTDRARPRAAGHADQSWRSGALRLVRDRVKGGSDHGVLNITTLLAGISGPAHCLSVTVNSGRDLSEARSVSVLTGLVFFLHDKSPAGR
jgi:hypothetical protein